MRGEQQHDVNSAGHTVIDGRKKNKGLVIAVSSGAVRMNDTMRSIKESPFPFPKAYEGCRTAKPG